MKQRLRRDFNPPAPVVLVEVRAPSEKEGVYFDGLIDTGADLCVIPENLVSKLNLPPDRRVRTSSLGGAAEAIVYRIDLLLDGMTFSEIEAVTTRRSYGLVGRNILRHLILRIDGPKEALELARPRAAR